MDSQEQTGHGQDASAGLGPDSFDWATFIGRLDPDIVGRRAPGGIGTFYGGTAVGRHALTVLLGDQFWRDAVQAYIEGGDEREMVWSVLRLVQPIPAAQECVRIWREGQGEERWEAVYLLKSLADPTAAELVPEFLIDRDPLVQAWGACVLDQLLWDRALEPEDAEPTVQLMEQHELESVRDRAAFIRDFLADREAPAEG